MNLTLSTEDHAAIAQHVAESIAAHLTQVQFAPRGMTEASAAEYLGVSQYSLRRSRTKGKLKGVPAPVWRKAGGNVVYLREELDEWLDGLNRYDWRGFK